MLTIINNQKRIFFNQVLFKHVVTTLINHLGIADKEITISFVTPNRIKELNKEYRGKDYVTDVLSFNIEDEFAPGILGDIIICPHRALTQADEIGNTLDEEMVFLTMHGLLHLIGYDHETSADETVMLDKQQELKKFLQGKFELWR